VLSLCGHPCTWSPTVVDRRPSSQITASPLTRAEPRVPLHRLLARCTAMPQTRSHAARIEVQAWLTPCAAIHRAIAAPHGFLHAGHRLASSDEWTPARRPLWGSELPRVFAGKVSTASGLQRRPRRGRDEGDGAMGETCDHLWRMLRFGSHHHACERRDHGLRGGPRIEGRECLAGHCLPPAALDPTRPRRTHGVQRLPHDGVLTAELQCQGAQRAPLQLSAALEALPVPTLGMCTRPLAALL